MSQIGGRSGRSPARARSSSFFGCDPLGTRSRPTSSSLLPASTLFHPVERPAPPTAQSAGSPGQGEAVSVASLGKREPSDRPLPFQSGQGLDCPAGVVRQKVGTAGSPVTWDPDQVPGSGCGLDDVPVLSCR